MRGIMAAMAGLLATELMPVALQPRSSAPRNRSRHTGQAKIRRAAKKARNKKRRGQ